ncbi:MAG: hypothetical protein ACK2TV_02160, partial [Anaerolineales bacterium]
EVWVVLNHVNADQWEKHKEFVMNTLIPAAQKIVPAEMGQTRFLYANEPNEDGTYTSVFLMDPVVENGNYDIEDILKKAHGDEQGQAFEEIWEQTLAVDQVGFSVKQSAW